MIFIIARYDYNISDDYKSPKFVSYNIDPLDYRNNYNTMIMENKL